MKIYLIIGKYYDHYEGATMPNVLEAWDEYVREENAEGYAEALAKWHEETGKKHSTLAGVKELTIEVDGDAVAALFEPSEYILKAEIVE